MARIGTLWHTHHVSSDVDQLSTRAFSHVYRNMAHDAASPTEELTNLIAHQSLIPLLGGLSLQFVQASKECMINFPSNYCSSC